MTAVPSSRRVVRPPVEDYRLPRSREARQAYAAPVGSDSLRLLAVLAAPITPVELRQIPAVGILRQAWNGRFVGDAEQVRWHASPELPPVAEQVESPYQPGARFSFNDDDSAWYGFVGY